MKIPRVSNKMGAWCVEHMQEFTSNTEAFYARNVENVYAVFSYGTHFPIAMYDRQVNKWFHNKGRYSVTTSKHQNLAGHRSEGVDTAFLQHLIRSGGVINAVDRRLVGDEFIENIRAITDNFDMANNHSIRRTA
jgi:hypothetical protein